MRGRGKRGRQWRSKRAGQSARRSPSRRRTRRRRSRTRRHWRLCTHRHYPSCSGSSWWTSTSLLGSCRCVCCASSSSQATLRLTRAMRTRRSCSTNSLCACTCSARRSAGEGRGRFTSLSRGTRRTRSPKSTTKRSRCSGQSACVRTYSPGCRSWAPPPPPSRRPAHRARPTGTSAASRRASCAAATGGPRCVGAAWRCAFSPPQRRARNWGRPPPPMGLLPELLLAPVASTRVQTLEARGHSKAPTG
mmetsp:Transcript_23464/g.59490  ORF Transcript_23464/g.59490 Transcript_23464/m.59490 type:complete len:248 (+) Transcript_23464:447-1190(+)